MQSLGQTCGCLVAGLAVLLFSEVAPRPQGPLQSQLRLEAVKQSILDRLGLQRPPTVRQVLGRDELQKARKLYRETLARVGANRTATVHLLKPKMQRLSDSAPRRPQAPGLFRLELSRTSALHRDLEVLRAELSLFKRLLGLPRSNATGPAWVNVYQLGAGGRAAPVLLDSQELSSSSPTLRLEDAVAAWLASPEQRLHLGLELPAGVAMGLEEGTEAPLLEVEAREPPRVRKARQLDEECGKGDGNCCLRSLKVSFEAIGWADWVVAPHSYSMKFCEGSCPHNYKPASMHAQIKARLHSLSGETPAPCCVPAAYEPMVLMHYGGDGKVVTQLFEDMIVTACHCA